MANEVALTAAQIGLVDPAKAEVKTYIAGATITKGQVVAVDTDGTIDPADASAGGGYLYQQVVGIALNGGGAGQAIDVCQNGELYGFTVSGLSVGDIMYLSDTAGSLSTVAGTVTARLGRVTCLADKSATKVVRIFVDWAAALWA
jgi:hypothetical protein